jgi:dihydrolipoamide dehydrogenase
MKKYSKFLLLILIIILVTSFFYFDLKTYLTLEYIKSNLASFQEFYRENKWPAIGVYFAVYVLTTSLSLPGATILTLLGGALFGLWSGFLIISFASSLGATLAFLISRFILRDFVESRFKSQLEKINKGIKKEGAIYLLSLRLIPIFPFFVINLTMGLTQIGTLTYYVVSQVGMILGTFVYVNAGVQLSEIEKLSDIVSTKLLISFALLGVLPLVSRKIMNTIKSTKVYRSYKKPKKFDYNMVVIGAGSAGLVTAYISAAVKSKVALVEKNKMGGDCLNTGCVPSKALLKSAKVMNTVKGAQEFGIEASLKSVDFKKVMGRIHKVIQDIEPHDSIERYTKLGVECIKGSAEIISPWEVKVNNQILTTKNITIATGASPTIPPIPGIEDVNILTSENLWKLKELPSRLTILGGGPIGCEMAQAFSRLGSQVTLIEMGDRLLSKEDPEVSEMIEKRLSLEGVRVLTRHQAIKFESRIVHCENQDEKIKINFDQVLIAVGRKANITGFGLENLKIQTNQDATIQANEYMQTNYPNIYVCGDVTGPYQLTHTASHQAWYCAVNALFGTFKKFKVDYSVIPWATYTSPEVATVGLTEKEAKASGVDYELITYEIEDLDRAIADSTNYGVVRVLTKKGSDQILGATIVSEEASNMIIEFISAMKNDYGLNQILGTIHPYPSMIEANKYAAGNWKRMSTNPKVYPWLIRFHRWMRG